MRPTIRRKRSNFGLTTASFSKSCGAWREQGWKFNPIALGDRLKELRGLENQNLPANGRFSLMYSEPTPAPLASTPTPTPHVLCGRYTLDGESYPIPCLAQQ